MDCDVCKIEFKSAKPNPSIGEGQLFGGSRMWVNVCEGHVGRVVELDRCPGEICGFCNTESRRGCKNEKCQKLHDDMQSLKGRVFKRIAAAKAAVLTRETGA